MRGGCGLRYHVRMSELPYFTYHPDPLKTGYVAPSDLECIVCGRARGYVYTRDPLGGGDGEELESPICPWCIADGSAARELEIELVDAWNLTRAGIAPDIVQEVALRTPGFESWQGERWLSHCDDACEFHGDLPPERLKDLDPAARAALMSELPVDWTWDSVVSVYEPGGQPGIYWFTCRHCRTHLYYADHT